jgi:Xaa-Arg dipeptidase
MAGLGDIEQARATAVAAIDAADGELRDLSLDIHSHPELAYEEVHAHEVLTAFLEERGFQVERGAYGLPTAFRATAGSGGPTVAVLSEYDALPGIGHACGHNLIATSGVAAGLAAAEVLGEGDGTIVVIGTPAEERGGGKVDLINAGAFDGVDAAMMMHPGGQSPQMPPGSVRVNGKPNALHALTVRYKGKNAHAAGRPWDGLNALDALLHAYNGISLLRQQMRPSARVHGIITEGGQAPNIIPDETAAYFYVREDVMANLEVLKPRVVACFEAAALATGTELELVWQGNPYTDMQNSTPLSDTFTKHAIEMGMDPVEPEMAGAGSTDMGNVTYAVPGLHPSYAVESNAGNHNAGFTEAAGSEEGHARMIAASKALALTVLDLFAEPELLVEAKREFDERAAANGG